MVAAMIGCINIYMNRMMLLWFTYFILNSYKRMINYTVVWGVIRGSGFAQVN